MIYLPSALMWRYAVTEFDSSKRVSDEDIQTILESGRLAPSSFGLEPWVFVVVKNPEVRTRLRAAGYDQPKITEASHLIVLAQRTDLEAVEDEFIERSAHIQGVERTALAPLQAMISGALNAKTPEEIQTWTRAQVYIPLGIMIASASLMGIDNAPMEGFNPEKVDEILGLQEKSLTARVMLALGYRAHDPKRPKVRRPFDEVVITV